MLNFKLKLTRLSLKHHLLEHIWKSNLYTQVICMSQIH